MIGWGVVATRLWGAWSHWAVMYVGAWMLHLAHTRHPG